MSVKNEKKLLDSLIEENVSVMGYEFDSNSDRWKLDRNTCVNTSFLSEFNSDLREDMRNTLKYFAESLSASYTNRLCFSIRKFVKLTGESSFSELALLTFKSLMGKKGEPDLATLRTFLRQLKGLGFKSIDNSSHKLMDAWRLDGTNKGVPVLSLCPETGPFSDVEFETILLKSDQKYASRGLTIEEYNLIQLFTATGRRPIQLSNLKLCDLFLDDSAIGKLIYIINIPRAKVRGGNFRLAFTKFALIEEIGQIISLQIESVKEKSEKLLGRPLRIIEEKSLPLFPDYSAVRQLKNMSFGEIDALLERDVLHIKTLNLSINTTRAIQKLGIVSERTGSALRANPYRFRYTLGTRAARANSGVLTIATLLDHSDTQSAGIYVQNHPDHAEKISSIMNEPMLKYAQAFQGKLVSSETEAKEGFPDATKVRTEDFDSTVGSCGASACSSCQPTACYTCPKFMPWKDAPHSSVLATLIDEREKIRVETEDLAVAAVNDLAIIAVGQVIKQCAENHTRNIQ
ncbi:site-specific integrase [Colwellia sp. Bg11-28]|uniref:site-specific integrase n=1 Tax=Colwellia sp. Bg11-28 TaxID=2058305 RepID=UPI000C3225D4|nr:site-specific integrase [Colwellia sp. Bg11-28]PKH89528.1 site-specific integrase [Colwellia sp. Bg11-28]